LRTSAISKPARVRPPSNSGMRICGAKLHATPVNRLDSAVLASPAKPVSEIDG
jgi:hypothetical protein